jgi:hypothetical protein
MVELMDEPVIGKHFRPLVEFHESWAPGKSACFLPWLLYTITVENIDMVRKELKAGRVSLQCTEPTAVAKGSFSIGA